MAAVCEYRSYLKNKLINPDTILNNDERLEILDTIKRTIIFGESDSLLLIGAKGCGKAALIQDVIEELETDTRLIGNYIVVELHGLLHTDDKIAFRDIVRQLNVNLILGDHVYGSSSDMLSFALKTFQTEEKNMSKSVIFIVHELHRFCMHHHQTLLYNLFDIAQSKKAVCVIGTTYKQNIAELFEKRVNSRFSHHKVMLRTSSVFSEKIEYFRYILLLPLNEEFDPEFVHSWNRNVEQLSSNKTVVDILQGRFYVSKSIKWFNDLLFVAVSMLNEDNPMLTVDHFEKAFKLCSESNASVMLENLSVLELCLVIAMYHHTKRYDSKPLNFEMIYQRYLKFAKKCSAVPVVERPVAMKAFELLKMIGLIHKVGCSLSKKVTIKEYILYQFSITDEHIKEGIQNCKDLPTEVMQWAGSYADET